MRLVHRPQQTHVHRLVTTARKLLLRHPAQDAQRLTAQGRLVTTPQATIPTSAVHHAHAL